VFNLSHFLRTVVILIFVLFPLFSISADEKDAFDLGKKAFDNNQYQLALVYFKQAKNNGLDTVSLTYNVAVTHYKLEQFEQSKIYFNKIRSNPKMTSLVEYNLGLIELKLNNNKMAVELFNNVYQNTSKKKLKSLAKKQLKKLNVTVKNKSKNKVKARLSIGNAFTDNVTSISTGTASGEADSFTVLVASIEGALTNTFKQGITAKVRYLNQNYSKFDQYDYSDTEFNVKYNFINGSYENYIVAFTRKSNLNSKSYQTRTGFEAKLKNLINKKKSLIYRYRYEDITEDQNRYLYLSGYRQRFRVGYFVKGNKNTNRIWYQIEVNDRNDTLTRSYSPTRHTLRYSYSLALTTKWKSRTDLEYRYSDYPNVAIQDRQDDRIRFLTGISYKLSKSLKFRGRYEYRNNASTDPTYVYKRNVYYFDLKFKI